MLYLLSVVPGIGLLHVDIHEKRMKKMGDPGVNQCEQMAKNTSAFPELDYVPALVCRQFQDIIFYVCVSVYMCTK